MEAGGGHADHPRADDNDVHDAQESCRASARRSGPPFAICLCWFALNSARVTGRPPGLSRGGARSSPRSRRPGVGRAGFDQLAIDHRVDAGGRQRRFGKAGQVGDGGGASNTTTSA